jgi:hypothetical protein
MPPGDQKTLTAVPVPTVITIGCSPDLNDRVARALASTGVAFKDCEISNAATLVAARLPLVIVLVEDLYAFDPDEFDALARDVRASLLRVDEDITEATLELLLHAAIEATVARRKQPAVATPAEENLRVTRPANQTGVRRKRSRSGADFEAAPLSEGSR